MSSLIYFGPLNVEIDQSCVRVCVHISPSGEFIICGPQGDDGLTSGTHHWHFGVALISCTELRLRGSYGWGSEIV